jgi:hypothetical protein
MEGIVIKKLLLVLALILPCVSHAAEVDYFLKIDSIMGESQAAGHEGEIDLKAWLWGPPRTDALLVSRI